MQALKPNLQRNKNAILLIWIVLITDVLSLFSDCFQYLLLTDAQDGIIILPSQAEANDTRQQVLAIVHLLAYIVSVVFFILWFRRAYYNLHQRFPGKLDYSEGWAAGAWFVPIISLFYPYKIMKELYVYTDEYNTMNQPGYESKTKTTWVGIWWTFWIVNNASGQFSFRYSLRAQGVEDFITYTQISLADDILSIILGIVTMKVIRDYSKMEEVFYELQPFGTNNTSGSTPASSVNS